MRRTFASHNHISGPARGYEQPAQIAVLLTQRQAYLASCALVEEVERNVVYLLEGDCAGDQGSVSLDDVQMGGVRSMDAQASARRLVHAIEALDAIGWPHAHMAPEFMRPLTERESSGVGPWGER